METTNTTNTNYPELDASQLLSKMRILSEINLDLSGIQDLDELYQQAIIQACERLGFDRLGLYLVDLEAEHLTGTYGIGVTGQLQSDKDDVLYFAENDWIKDAIFNEKRLLVEEDVDLWEEQEVVGHGWQVTAALWIRDTPIGVFFADNLISQQPLQSFVPELLAAYSSNIANLIERLQAQKSLRTQEQTVQAILEKQQQLHEVGLLLSNVKNAQDLYREAIVLGREKLGFSRLGLYVVNDEKGTVQGTYGTSQDGEIRAEDELFFNPDEDLWTHDLLHNQERLSVFDDIDLYDKDIVVGRGWNIIAALWSQNRPLGLLCADNLLDQQPLQPYHAEVLSAYGATITNLIDRIQAQDEHEQTVQAILEKQQQLHEVGLLLSNVKNTQDLYREAIVLGREKLGFSRLGLYVVKEDKNIIQGTYGIGLDGEIRTEDHLFFDPEKELWTHDFLHNQERLSVLDDIELYDKNTVVGRGWNIIAALWSQNRPLGLLFADNLLDQQPLQPYYAEVLSAYGATITNLIERIQAQERTETILQSVTVPMLISRVSDGKIFYTNEHLAEMVRLPLDELIGNQTPNFYVRNEDRKAIVDKIQAEGGFQNYELELQRADEDRFWGLLTAKLIRFEGEMAIITSVIDITTRKETQAATERQAIELQTVADLSTKITSIQEPKALMNLVVQETQKQFDLYHCHIFLMDERHKNLRIEACGWHEEAPADSNHGDSTIPLSAKQSLVAQAARTRQAVVANDVINDPNWLPNELLPDTRSELAVPMIVGDTVLGVLDVQATEVDRFKPVDLQIQSTLAAQIAVALENARSLEKSQQAIEELDQLTRSLTRDSWEEYLTILEERDTGFMYQAGEFVPVAEDEDVAKTKSETETAVSDANGQVSQSLRVHGEEIGHLTIFNETDEENIDAEIIMAAIAEQLSARVENIRLTEQTQRALAQTQDQAQRLGLLNEISARMSNVDTLDEVFSVIFDRISDLLSSDRVSIALVQPDGESVQILRHLGEEINAPTGTILPISSAMAQAMQERRIIVLDDNQTESIIKSSIVSPILSAGQAIGTLNVGSKRSGAFTDRDESLLRQLATMLSSVVENKQLLAAAQARAERERQVRTITDKIRRGVDREAILNIAQEEISKLIGAKQAKAQLGTKAQLLKRMQHTMEQAQKESA